MIRAPVCTKCGIIMRCKKNGFIVGFVSDRRYSSDKYECPICEAEVALLAREPYPEPPLNGVPVEADMMMREDQ